MIIFWIYVEGDLTAIPRQSLDILFSLSALSTANGLFNGGGDGAVATHPYVWSYTKA